MGMALRRLAACGALATLTLLAGLRGQDDLRDQITRNDGRVLSGRVVEPFAEHEILLLQGGRRVRIDRADVADVDLVADRVREFFQRRFRHRNSPRALRYLVDWAVSAGLPGLARLQAMALVLQDDDAQLHEFLGNRPGADGWLWRHDGRSLTKAQLEQALAKSPLRLVGERFALRCDAGLATGVDALLDLEHMGVVWFDRFGADLGLREVLEPVEVVTFRNAEEFPKWGFRPRPYYEPRPHADLARTFYAGAAPVRPELLFFVGMQGLLYRTMIGEGDRANPRDRVCPWVEIGLGMYFEHTMQGPAGFAEPGPLRAQDLEALRALGRGYRLTHLLHLPMYSSFYLADDTATAINWSAATMFVAWLLRDDNQPKTRKPFLAFVKAALIERQGDSSSAFDRIMGRRVELMEEPWREWLKQAAGF